MFTYEMRKMLAINWLHKMESHSDCCYIDGLVYPLRGGKITITFDGFCRYVITVKNVDVLGREITFKRKSILDALKDMENWCISESELPMTYKQNQCVEYVHWYAFILKYTFGERN